MTSNASQENIPAFGCQGEELFNKWMASPVNLEDDFRYTPDDLPAEVKRAKTYKDLCQLISQKTKWEFSWAGGHCLFSDGEGVYYCMAWSIEEMLDKWSR